MHLHPSLNLDTKETSFKQGLAGKRAGWDYLEKLLVLVNSTRIVVQLPWCFYSYKAQLR